MSPRVVLGIDLGAESGRVMAGRWDGSRLEVEEIHRFPNGPLDLGGSLRWNVGRLWEEIRLGLGRAAARGGERPASVGVDTWGLDYALLSASGELLGLPFCYRDARTRGMLGEALGRVSREELFAATGSQFLEINTLYQWMAHFRASPELWRAEPTFLMMPDWVNWCLTGERVVEFTNATTTQFLDPRSRDWARPLLDRLGLPTSGLPPVVAPGTLLGPLRPGLGGATGLGGAVVIAPATHDTASAVAAVPAGASSPGRWAYISSGTWSLVGIETRTPCLSEPARRYNLTNEGGVDGTWRVLKNVMGLWLVQRCRAALEAAGGAPDYAVLMEQAAQAAPCRSLVNPDDSRFLNPADMPAALRDFCRETGQPGPATPGEWVRCALDSLALRYARVLEQLEEVGGGPIETLHLVGGGSRNVLLNQLTADATGRVVVAGPAEATVTGNLLVQLAALGELGGLSDRRAVTAAGGERRVFEPRPGARALWDEARARSAGWPG